MKYKLKNAVITLKENFHENYEAMCVYGGCDLLLYISDISEDIYRQVSLIQQWLDDVTKGELQCRFNYLTGSYGLKHRVEDYASRKCLSGNNYVSGNVFTIYLASIGYEYKFISSTTPNAIFKIPRKYGMISQ